MKFISKALGMTPVKEITQLYLAEKRTLFFRCSKNHAKYASSILLSEFLSPVS